MSDQYRWLAGWYATRLHAVKADAGRTNYNDKLMPTEFVAECGAHVYEVPPTNWAQARFAQGLPRCKHCERRFEKS